MKKEINGVEEIKQPNAYLVFRTENEIIIQNWKREITIEWPTKGGRLENKTIKIKGTINATEYKEYKAKKKTNETTTEFEKRILPGLKKILTQKR